MESSLNSASEALEKEMSKMGIYFIEGALKGIIIIITNPFFYIPFSIFMIYKIIKKIYKKYKKKWD